MDFPAILGIATMVCGMIWTVDSCFFKQKRLAKAAQSLLTEPYKEPKLVEYARSFFPVLLIVFLVRSFIAEPFRIPTGSMKPTLLEGDFILVNKFVYGVRLPFFGTKVLKLHEPKNGDVLVFRYPNDPTVDFIKRVIGVPGDKISYRDKTIYLNGEPLTQKYIMQTADIDTSGHAWQVKHFRENLPNHPHSIYVHPGVAIPMEEITVPEGMFFVMGDNRDNSEDSRVWGFVPEKLILGKAFFVWLSFNSLTNDIRWKRMFHKIDILATKED